MPSIIAAAPTGDNHDDGAMLGRPAANRPPTSAAGLKPPSCTATVPSRPIAPSRKGFGPPGAR